jgi:hypothetical protein
MRYAGWLQATIAMWAAGCMREQAVGCGSPVSVGALIYCRSVWTSLPRRHRRDESLKKYGRACTPSTLLPGKLAVRRPGACPP